MVYVLYSQDYDSFDFQGVYEGPEGLNIDKLRDRFMANFDHRKLGEPKRVPYNGPKVPMRYGLCCSGSIPEGSLVWDNSSQEYKDYEKESKKAQNEWNKKRKDKINEFKEKYEGKDEQEMFLSYLEKEHGLKKIQAEFANL